jgi:hypothetical protein
MAKLQEAEGLVDNNLEDAYSSAVESMLLRLEAMAMKGQKIKYLDRYLSNTRSWIKCSNEIKKMVFRPTVDSVDPRTGLCDGYRLATKHLYS